MRCCPSVVEGVAHVPVIRPPVQLPAVPWVASAEVVDNPARPECRARGGSGAGPAAGRVRVAAFHLLRRHRLCGPAAGHGLPSPPGRPCLEPALPIAVAQQASGLGLGYSRDTISRCSNAVTAAPIAIAPTTSSVCHIPPPSGASARTSRAAIRPVSTTWAETKIVLQNQVVVTRGQIIVSY
jgi:hypothetical protein